MLVNVFDIFFPFFFSFSINSPTAGDIDREPDDELFGEDMGLIGCCCCADIDCVPGGSPVCEALFDGGSCDCGGC